MSEIKLFNKWDYDVDVRDPGLKGYINLTPVIVPRQSHGRHAQQQFYKNDVPIVERLMNKLFVPGHRGKRHKYSSSHCTGKSFANYNNIKDTFELIAEKTDENPIEVLVRAIENAAPREEVSAYQLGSIIARKAVVTAPQRRVDLALRHFTQGAYAKSQGSPKSASECLADEILAAYNDDRESFAIQQKERVEREAAGAR